MRHDQRLDGIWAPHRIVERGTVLVDDAMPGARTVRLAMRRGYFETSWDGYVAMSGDIVLGAAGQGTIDWLTPPRPGMQIELQGIYQLHDDRLTTCFAEFPRLSLADDFVDRFSTTRPAAFKSTAESRTVLTVWQRVSLVARFVIDPPA